MVKFERPAKPQILEDKAEIWKNELLDLVGKYESFDKIPKKEKDSFFNNTYNHTEIQQTFRDESKSKCVFCEGSAELTSFLNIEHFHPKSIYYEEAFEWVNLFPSCSRCNTSKLAHDTKKEPIVHPENDNPEDFFVYNNLLLIPSLNSPNKKKSQITIDKCDLWRISLLRELGGIQIEFAKEQLASSKTSDDEKELLTAEIAQREIDLIKLQNTQKLEILELNDQNQIVRKKLTNTEIENITRESGEAIRKIEAENIIKLDELKNKNVAGVLKSNFDAGLVEAEENLRVQISENAQKTISAKTLKELKALQDARKTIVETGEIAETNLKIKYVEKQLATLVLSNDQKKKLEQELFEFRSTIADKEIKLNEDKLAKELKAEEDAKKKKQEIIDASVELGKAVADFAFSYEKQQNDQALVDLGIRKEAELLAAGDNAQRREIITKKFAAEEAKIKTKQAKEDKAKALFDIAINTAVAVIKAAPNPVLMALAGIVGGLSAALVASKPIPKFKSGVEMLSGAGNETSDSIHAMLSRGERVVSAKTNKEFYPTLSAIHNGKISAKSLNDFVLNGHKIVVNNNQNDSKLLQSVENLTNTLAKQPKAEISIDKQGFSVFLSDSMQREQQLNDRYSL